MSQERTSFYLAAQTKRQLAQAARRLGKTQTEVVNEALAEYLAKLERRGSRSSAPARTPR